MIKTIFVRLSHIGLPVDFQLNEYEKGLWTRDIGTPLEAQNTVIDEHIEAGWYVLNVAQFQDEGGAVLAYTLRKSERSMKLDASVRQLADAQSQRDRARNSWRVPLAKGDRP